MVNFVVREEITFKARVIIVAPTEEGRKSTFQAWGLFKVVGQDEVDRLIREITERTKAGDDVDGMQVQMLDQSLIGWEGIDGADGAFEFTDANRAVLLNIPYVRAGFWEAYIDAISGKAKRGN